MWCVSHWRMKMVSYTIFSYRSKPLFTLASSPVRLLLNPLCPCNAPPSSFTARQQGTSSRRRPWGGGRTSWLRNHCSLKRSWSSGWVLPAACASGISPDSIRLPCTQGTQTTGVFSYIRLRGDAMFTVTEFWILIPLRLSLRIPEISISEFWYSLAWQAYLGENIAACTTHAKCAVHGNYRQFQPQG